MGVQLGRGVGVGEERGERQELQQQSRGYEPQDRTLKRWKKDTTGEERQSPQCMHLFVVGRGCVVCRPGRCDMLPREEAPKSKAGC